MGPKKSSLSVRKTARRRSVGPAATNAIRFTLQLFVPNNSPIRCTASFAFHEHFGVIEGSRYRGRAALFVMARKSRLPPSPAGQPLQPPSRWTMPTASAPQAAQRANLRGGFVTRPGQSRVHTPRATSRPAAASCDCITLIRGRGVGRRFF